MTPKDYNKITDDIKGLIENQFLSKEQINFPGKIVHQVESIYIDDFKAEQDIEDRNKIIIPEVSASVKVLLKSVENSFSSKTVQIKSNKSIKFILNIEMDNYVLFENDAVFYNTSNH